MTSAWRRPGGKPPSHLGSLSPFRLTTGLMVLALLTGGPAAAGGRAELTATDIRAAYLFNFSKFVVWPAGGSEPARDTLVVAVHNDPPTFRVLDRVSRTAVSNGRPLAIIHLEPGDPVPECHILYVGEVDTDDVARILRTPAARNALTVGTSDSFIRLGGIIRLLEVRNRLVFDVNLTPAEERHLAISSAMLKVAHEVVRTATADTGGE